MAISPVDNHHRPRRRSNRLQHISSWNIFSVDERPRLPPRHSLLALQRCWYVACYYCLIQNVAADLSLCTVTSSAPASADFAPVVSFSFAATKVNRDGLHVYAEAYVQMILFLVEKPRLVGRQDRHLHYLMEKLLLLKLYLSTASRMH